MYEIESNTYRLVSELKRTYAKLRRRQGRYELYNLMEKCLIEMKLSPQEEALCKS